MQCGVDSREWRQAQRVYILHCRAPCWKKLWHVRVSVPAAWRGGCRAGAPPDSLGVVPVSWRRALESRRRAPSEASLARSNASFGRVCEVVPCHARACTPIQRGSCMLDLSAGMRACIRDVCACIRHVCACSSHAGVHACVSECTRVWCVHADTGACVFARVVAPTSSPMRIAHGHLLQHVVHMYACMCVHMFWPSSIPWGHSATSTQARGRGEPCRPTPCPRL